MGRIEKQKRELMEECNKRLLNEQEDGDNPNMFCINLRETWGDKYSDIMGKILKKEKMTYEDICDFNLDEEEQKRLTSLYDPKH